jgi:LytS/YehU family sensor histidine kinase
MRISWLPLVYSAMLFYFNYFFLIDKFVFSKKIPAYVIINLLAIVLLAFISFQIKETYFPKIKEPIASALAAARPKPSRNFLIYKDNIYLVFTIIVALAIRITERWTKAEAGIREAEKEKLNSELMHLKYQLQPHFFFNSLNNIYSLISISPSDAQEAVHSLGKLMRYLIYDTEAPRVELKSEVEFMQRYIELMKLRISDKTKVAADFQKISAHRKIAPLLFVSLIENAFKHGVSSTQCSEIHFSLQMTEQEVIFSASNFNFPKSDKDESGSGIGLNNLRKRLDLLYPGKYTFKTELNNNIFHSELRIKTD